MYSAVFRVEPNTEICSGKETWWLRLGRWYRSSTEPINVRPYGIEKKTYPAGFHIYTNKKAALAMALYGYNNVVVMVKFRKVVAKGLQDVDNVVIAREIKLIKEVT